MSLETLKSPFGPVLQAIIDRRSTPKLSEPAPSHEEVERLLMAAESAPDHGRIKPWRFYLIEGDARVRLGEQFARADGVDGEDQRAVDKAKQMPLRAPMLIAVVAKVDAEHKKVPQIEQAVAVGAAVQNIQLAAHEMGYGVMWRTGAMSEDVSIRQLFGLEGQDHIIGFLYIGTPEKRLAAHSERELRVGLEERTVKWLNVGEELPWTRS